MWQSWDSPTDEETLTIARNMSEGIAREETNKAVTPTALEGVWRFGFEGSYDIDEVLEGWDRKRCVSEALLSLTPREERVVRLLFGMGCGEHTLDEVGEEFSLSRERIRQIEAKALRKLKRPRIAKRLASFKTGIAAPPAHAWQPRCHPQRRALDPVLETDVNGNHFRITIKRWVYDDANYARALGMPGPYFLFDHNGQEFVGAEQELRRIP